MSKQDGRTADRWLLGGVVVLVVVALILAGAGYLVYRDASDARSTADTTRRRVAALTTAGRVAGQSLARLRAATNRLDAALAGSAAAVRAETDAANHAVDIANGAADVYNLGKMGIADALRAQAGAAVADLDARAQASSAARAELGAARSEFAAAAAAVGGG